MNRKKILIVDDDESILDALSFVLEDEGYVVETTQIARETYRKISKFQPDVILLDVLLSGEDGRVICKKLKTNKETKSIPIIMISAHPTAAKSTLEVGANAFVAKPFELGDLTEKIQQYTGR